MANWFSLVLIGSHWFSWHFNTVFNIPKHSRGVRSRKFRKYLVGAFQARCCGTWRWSLEALEIRWKKPKRAKHMVESHAVTCSHCGSRCHMHVTWHGRTLAVAEMTLIVAARGSSCCRALSPVSNIGCPSDVHRMSIGMSISFSRPIILMDPVSESISVQSNMCIELYRYTSGISVPVYVLHSLSVSSIICLDGTFMSSSVWSGWTSEIDTLIQHTSEIPELSSRWKYQTSHRSTLLFQELPGRGSLLVSSAISSDFFSCPIFDSIKIWFIDYHWLSLIRGFTFRCSISSLSSLLTAFWSLLNRCDLPWFWKLPFHPWQPGVHQNQQKSTKTTTTSVTSLQYVQYVFGDFWLLDFGSSGSFDV